MSLLVDIGLMLAAGASVALMLSCWSRRIAQLNDVEAQNHWFEMEILRAEAADGGVERTGYGRGGRAV